MKTLAIDSIEKTWSFPPAPRWERHLERFRYHLLWDVVPTAVILVLLGGGTLLAARSIHPADTRPSASLLKDQVPAEKTTLDFSTKQPVSLAETSREAIMKSDNINVSPFSIHRAFVVQFRSQSGAGQERISGRVEHVATNCSASFQSWEEMRAFMDRALRQARAQSPEGSDAPCKRTR